MRNSFFSIFAHQFNTEIVAQLVRASVCGTEGRGFETHRSPKKTKPCCCCNKVFLLKSSVYMKVTLFLLPIISAFIGWFLMWICIKLLFHPKQPKKILGLTIQGIFPAKQEQLAIKSGRLISSKLFSFSNLEEKIADPQSVSKLLPVLETHIDIFLREKLPVQIPMLGMLIGDKTISQVKGVFMKELEELFPLLMKQYMNTLQSELDLETMITEKVRKLPPASIEQVVNETLYPQFKLVKIIGAVIGFIIGLVQILLTIAAM